MSENPDQQYLPWGNMLEEAVSLLEFGFKSFD